MQMPPKGPCVEKDNGRALVKADPETSFVVDAKINPKSYGWKLLNCAQNEHKESSLHFCHPNVPQE